MRAYNTRALSRKVTSYVFVLASFKNGNSPNCNEFLFCSSEYLTDENGPRQCKLQFMMGGIYWSFCSFSLFPIKLGKNARLQAKIGRMRGYEEVEGFVSQFQVEETNNRVRIS